MVAGVDVAADELAGLGVCAGNNEVLAVHQIPLEAGGYKTVDMLSDGDEDLSGKMATLVGGGRLAFAGGEGGVGGGVGG